MVFNENWYGDEQANKIAELAKQSPEGLIIEIGCWEGKSTVALANAVYPRNVIAIDTWLGNVEESNTHPSVATAKERDVFSQFLQNITDLTLGNVLPVRLSWQGALTKNDYKNIAFVHIDACHDYSSVLSTLEQYYPRMVSGGIMCGDDFQTASATREDLQGGVEKAVKEYFGDRLQTSNNLWWVIC